MIVLAAFSVFIFGAIIGSFLNVVILRYNTGAGLGGRSGCFSCGHELCASELIPVLSYLLLRGRCSECKSKISIQYPLVELASGFLFLLSAFEAFHGILDLAALATFAFYALCWSFLLIIFAYDLRHKIIPDGIVFAFAGVSLVALFVQKGPALLSFPGYLDLFAGPLFFLPFYSLWKISHGTWIGLGDGKLALGIGWFLGFVSGASAIISAFWIGAIVSLFAMAYEKYFGSSKSLTMKSEIPFAPFLILGILIAFIWAPDFFGFHILFTL